jgi:hypothetical protein
MAWRQNSRKNNPLIILNRNNKIAIKKILKEAEKVKKPAKTFL